LSNLLFFLEMHLVLLMTGSHNTFIMAESWFDWRVQDYKGIAVAPPYKCFPCKRRCPSNILVCSLSQTPYLSSNWSSVSLLLLLLFFSFPRHLTYLANDCRANRPKSYLSRTIGWDQYPHGRWGDSHNPSYGALSDYQVHIFTELNSLVLSF
jgi:hypothetical protein